MAEMLGIMLVVLVAQTLMVSALIVGGVVEKRRKSSRVVSRYE